MSLSLTLCTRRCSPGIPDPECPVHGSRRPAFTSPTEVTYAEGLVATILQDHRRVRNVRACTACAWRPDRPGYASNPEDTLRRHADFNAHLAAVIVQALS